LIGYEVTTGNPIYLPLHHTGFTGMTQKAGKTTAVEGCVMRSGFRGITFRTKRGEVGFESTGIEIKPYFLERSDWQYVESLIEATMRENQRFNRSWIIRACEGTKGLNDVWENIKVAKKKASGLALSVYTNLDAYFKIVVPEIRKYDFAKNLQMGESISVMNLIGMPTEVQALVIRSTVDYIYDHEKDVIVVIPECWKFIGPIQTPVTYAAERLIREGASVGIYLFVDSQDISGINPHIRGQIDNWILGRQKYEHEIDRTLMAIPVKNKPTKEQIQTLKLGHFFAACDVWVKEIYFLPWQIPEEIGIAVAKGQKEAEFVKDMLENRRNENRKEDEDLAYKERAELAEQKVRTLEAAMDEQKKKLETWISPEQMNEAIMKKLVPIEEAFDALKEKFAKYEEFEGALKAIIGQPEIAATTLLPVSVATQLTVADIDERLNQRLTKPELTRIVTVNVDERIKELIKNTIVDRIIAKIKSLPDPAKKAALWMYEKKQAKVSELYSYMYDKGLGAGRIPGAFYMNVINPLDNTWLIINESGNIRWVLEEKLSTEFKDLLHSEDVKKIAEYLTSLLL
jgi:hypothetical protein